jgi:hypothetical protein
VRSPGWPIVVVVAAATVLGAACSSGGDSSEHPAKATTTTGAPQSRSAKVVDAFVDGLLVTAPDNITKHDARCIGSRVVFEMGTDEIVARALVTDPDAVDEDGNPVDTNSLTPELRRAVLRAFTYCLTPQQLAAIAPTVSLDPGGTVPGDIEG